MITGLSLGTSHAPPRLIKTVELRGATKCGIEFILAFLVISSPVVIFMNPAFAVTKGTTIDTSNDHATVSSPSPTTSITETNPSATVGTPTVQAALQIPRTLQSTDLVNSLAFYEVTFITSTTGAIDKIRMDFPPGTNIAAAGVIEKVGIGGGTLLKSGSSITYDVTTPVSILAGTFIRLEIFGIKNPGITSTSFTATLTTRDSGGNLIDGPSTTNVYTIKQIGTNDIADNSITSTKPAESFMKRVTLLDNAAGNLQGWNPDGVSTDFGIVEPLVIGTTATTGSFVSIYVEAGANHSCDVISSSMGHFLIRCSTPPSQGDQLHYVVENLPPNVL